MVAKKRAIIISLVVVVLGGIMSALPKINDMYEQSRLQPELELQAALDRMMNLSSFTFDITSTFNVEGRTQNISSVAGEKEGENVHIKGEMVKTPVDIYFIDGTIYNYDSTASRWMVIESGTSSTAELLISELKPLTYLMYEDLQNIEKVGFEEIDGDNCIKLRFSGVIKNSLINKMWQDFNCQLWIDYKQDIIKKVEITAINKNNNKTSLQIIMHFKDIDQKINIRPPEF